MKIVIDINDEIYETLKKCEEMTSELRSGKTFISKIYTAVANGTPLPKGHGMLIDADKLLEKQYRIDDSATLSTRDVVDVEDVDDAPTIIEADKEGD